MRKLTFGVANSLDNYIARKDGALDWLMWGKEAASVMTQYWKTIDTVLMGRKTYEVALANNKRIKDPYPGLKSYVFSRTLDKSAHKSVEIISHDAVSFVRHLKEEDGKDICLMGGGDLARTFFEASLIDEIGFNIHPIVLGSGIPLFRELNHQIELELVESNTFKNGCVYVVYRVK